MKQEEVAGTQPALKGTGDSSMSRYSFWVLCENSDLLHIKEFAHRKRFSAEEIKSYINRLKYQQMRRKKKNRWSLGIIANTKPFNFMAIGEIKPNHRNFNATF